MAASEVHPLLDGSDHQQTEDEADVGAPTRRTGHIAKDILGWTYGLFLGWQLLAMIVYMIRTIRCCYTEKQASFQCRSKSQILYHSEYVQLAWLLSQISNSVLCLAVFSKLPNFLGYINTFKKLAGLPSFWSLVFLLVLALSGYVIILYLNDVFPMQNALVVAFAIHCVLLVPLVGLTNYLSMSSLRLVYPKFLYTLIKLTIILYFVQTFALFIVGSIQLTFDVNGLDARTDTSEKFRKTFGVLRRFTAVVFYYRVGTFFWKRILIEDKSLLGFHH